MNRDGAVPSDATVSQRLSRPQSRSFLGSAVEDLGRLREITRVLWRHGFASLAIRSGFSGSHEAGGITPVDARSDPRDAALRFRKALEELGPTFVKVGQILSTRADLLPPPFIAELTKLQDQAPRLDSAEVRVAVEEGLGAPIDELFSDFENEPLASASIAQTHLARLPGGTEVVVKVQRPGIADTIHSDLKLLFLFARLLETTIAEMELYAPGDIVRALDDAISMELDFVNEAANLERMGRCFEGDPDVKIPTLYRSHTSRTVLTLERIRGRKVDELEPRSEEAKKVIRQYLDAYYRMTIEHAFFHADPHPGNSFITDDGKLAFIDFGLCGDLSPNQQDQIINLIVAVVAGDIDGIARAFLRMGRPMGHIPMNAFKAEIATMRDRYLRRSIGGIEVGVFVSECMDAAQRFRVRVATEYALLTKAGGTIDGIIRRLDPDFDLLAAGQVYARRMLSDRYTSNRMTQELLGGAMSLSHFLREVPDQLSQILMDAESGHLQINLENDDLKHFGAELNTQTTRLFMAICCAGLIIATPIWFHNEKVWWGPIPVTTVLCAIVANMLGWLGMGWHLLGGSLKKVSISPLLQFFFKKR